MNSSRWNRLLLTGGAGRLGSQLRAALRDLAASVRVTDVNGLAGATADEELVQADLADMDAVLPLLEGVDVVVHLGAVMPQAPWESVLQANIVGSFNVFEAARQAGVKRIIFASSHHAVGMYARSERLDADSPARPGNLYGLSKAFGETLARMYHDKHGIEMACLRIGSCFETPTDERMLSTWLSHEDMIQLCRRCLQTPSIGYCVVYGVSANSRSWWSNDKAAYLGYQPQRSADVFAELLATERKAEASDPHSHTHLQGGRFTQLVP